MSDVDTPESRKPARRHRARRRARRQRRSPAACAATCIGLALATVLTVASFYVARSTPGLDAEHPVALSVLAVAQMGVHLVFFLHITTGPDNTNNVLALAFGLLIVFLLVVRLALDHEQPQPQHDADGSDDADAALSAGLE